MSRFGPLLAAVFSAVPQGEMLSLVQHQARRMATPQRIEVAKRRRFITSGVDPALWSGSDLSAGNASALTIQRGGQLPVALQPPLLSPGIMRTDTAQIMGLYNTGTNLLQSLLDKNFPGMFSRSLFGCGFWKHSYLSQLNKYRPDSLENCRDAVGIAIVRNPFSWLRSGKLGDFYDLNDCRNADDWLTRACAYPYYTPSGMGGLTFESIEDIWNKFNSDYLSLQSFQLSRAIVIKYETLVTDTEYVLQRIADLANLTAPETVIQTEENMSPTSSHEASARQDAIDAINSRNYMDYFTMEEKQEICSRIDPNVMKAYAYTICEELFPSR